MIDCSAVVDYEDLEEFFDILKEINKNGGLNGCCN